MNNNDRWKEPTRNRSAEIFRHAMLVLLALFGGAGALQVSVGAVSVSKSLSQMNQDAYFVSLPHFAGVFDGVSSCKESRAYAQALARGAQSYLKNEVVETEWSAQAQVALQRAADSANGFNGAATACLLRLDLEQAQACCYTIGDSGCVVLRPGDTPGSFAVAGQSAIKLHKSGAPYQLAGGRFISDDVSSGESAVFDIDVGYTVFIFSDGIGDSLDALDFAQIMSASDDKSLEHIANSIVREAQERATKIDDTTVVAVEIMADQAAAGSRVRVVGGALDGKCGDVVRLRDDDQTPILRLDGSPMLLALTADRLKVVPRGFRPA